MQSQFRLNRVPEKVPEKVWGALVQSQVRSTGEGSRQVQGSEKVWEALVQTQLRHFQRLVSQHASEQIVKIKCCGCWGYHRSAAKFLSQGCLSLNLSLRNKFLSVADSLPTPDGR